MILDKNGRRDERRNEGREKGEEEVGNTHSTVSLLPKKRERGNNNNIPFGAKKEKAAGQTYPNTAS